MMEVEGEKMAKQVYMEIRGITKEIYCDNKEISCVNSEINGINTEIYGVDIKESLQKGLGKENVGGEESFSQSCFQNDNIL